jgi:hypothetical protein
VVVAVVVIPQAALAGPVAVVTAPPGMVTPGEQTLAVVAAVARTLVALAVRVSLFLRYLSKRL